MSQAEKDVTITAPNGLTARLILGDCLSILPTLGRVDALVSDPPYGVLSATGSAATRRATHNTSDGRMAWDVAPDAAAVQALLAAGDVQALWGGCHLELPPTTGYLIWDKQIDGLNFGECEFCWTNQRFAPRLFRWRAAALRAGCNAIYIEIEPKYFAIAERRIRAEAAQLKLFDAPPPIPPAQKSLM